jgi:Pyruvate/2-oxoacid:ferredoxin oxidoreductase gamma subunit
LSIAVVALASLLRDTGLFPPKAFSSAISTFQKPKIAETNLKALEAGATLDGH